MRLPVDRPLVRPSVGHSSAERSPIAASPEAGPLSPRVALSLGLFATIAVLVGVGIFVDTAASYFEPVHTAHRPRVELAIGADGGFVSIACGEERQLPNGLTARIECEDDAPRSE